MMFLILIVAAIVFAYANRVKLRAWVQSKLPQELAPPTVLPPAKPTDAQLAEQLDHPKTDTPDPPKTA